MDISIEGLYCTKHDVYLCKVSDLRDDIVPKYKENIMSLFIVSLNTETDSVEEKLTEVLAEADKAEMPHNIVQYQWPKVLALA